MRGDSKVTAAACFPFFFESFISFKNCFCLGILKSDIGNLIAIAMILEMAMIFGMEE